MANSLLDFVISLLRDPEAAARYDADPARALADAGLTEVTTVDVQNLIPVVAESLPMSAVGSATFGTESTDNVWTSGAATAAFDAFDLPVPVLVDAVVDALPVVTPVVSDIVDVEGPDLDLVSAPQFDELALEPVAESGLTDEDWVPPVADPYLGDRALGFDVFE